MNDFSVEKESAFSANVELPDHVHQEARRLIPTLIDQAVIIADGDGRVTYVNPIAERLTEFTDSQARGRLLCEVFMPVTDDLDGTEKGRSDIVTNSDGDEYRFDSSTFRTPSGKQYCVQGRAVPIKQLDGIDRTLVIFRDVGALRRAERGLIYRSTHDLLTGLLNRGEFVRRLDELVDTERTDQAHVLLYLDLDEFKIINATGSHLAGDELLRQVGGILQCHVRGSDMVARLGGDEFGVLLEHCSTGEGRRIADQIRWSIQDLKFAWDAKSFAVGVSIGMVEVEPHQGDVSTWLRDADTACYAAKEEGRNQVHLFGSDAMEREHHAGRMKALAMLHDAIANDRLLLYAQPIVPLLESPLELPHMEILLRMVDEHGNIILPGAFLPAAERHHQMPLIDRWVVTHTFSVLKRLCISDSYIFAINLSGQSIGRIDFLHFVIESLDQFDINPKNLCFEITEGAAIGNVDHAEGFMSVLGARGCRFALDDFGVGMSSLAYLRRLPIDYLKIDGSFVKNLSADPINGALIRAIQAVARTTGVKTVAECVETTADLRLLQEIGVDLVQGYLIAEPMQMEMLCQLDFTELDVSAIDHSTIQSPQA
jgi:diguanylate cyclase (GGDEF)-like protein/PAS domain S-box-containing protein